MITLFTIPKAFVGHIGVIQRNAIRSWTALAGVQVVLLGDEEGTQAAAAEFGVTHISEISRSDLGTPLLDDAFARAEAIATEPLRCFVNCDIVLFDDFVPAVAAAQAGAGPAFLMVGRSLGLEVGGPLALDDPEERARLRLRARAEGRSRGATAIDYFVFSVGLFDPLPPFAVGRARFDNWLVWRARRRASVVDASDAVLAVHQSHDYAHVRGGLEEAHFGVEAERNLTLAGGKRRIYTIHDASHTLAADGSVRPNLGSVLRTRENLRKVAWKLSRR